MKTLTSGNLGRAISFLLLSFATVLHAQTPQNPLPISGPTIITVPGYYRLTKNINFNGSSGNIITAQASNVTIDFNNFNIRGPAGNPAQSVIGVYANEIGNLTIKNGGISYCDIGIEISGTKDPPTTHDTNQLIQNMRISHCFEYGVYVPHTSLASIVKDCQFSQIGGSTKADAVSGVAIYSFDVSLLVKDNAISWVSGAAASLDQSYGIYGCVAVRNFISNCHFGVTNCKYQNNLTGAVTVPFSGGTDAGGNY